MKILTADNIMNDYIKLKKMAKSYITKNNYNAALNIIRILSNIMCDFNIIYSDDEVESMLAKITNETISQSDYIPEVGTHMFYDFFSLDTRGLTTIYLKALIELGHKIVFVTYEKNMNYFESSKIKKCIDAYPNAHVEFIKDNLNEIDTIICLDEIIQKYKPERILVHSHPSDVSVTCSMLANNCTEKFLINITDHTFWIGKTAYNYFIEFRDYGYTISCKYRGINNNKLLVLPYYPVRTEFNNNVELPFDHNSIRYIMTGGSLYKIYGSPMYFQIVKHILDNYESTNFVYIGNGNSEPLTKFIKENNYKNRFYYFQERKDFEGILSNAYFYLSTYPIQGALMTQYAVVNGVIPLEFSDGQIPSNDLESVLINIGPNDKFTYYSLKELYSEIDKLMNDTTYKLNKESRLINLIISENEFKEQLSNILINHKSDYIGKEIKIDVNRFSEIYIDAENNVNHNYNLMIARSKNVKVASILPIRFLKGCMKYLLLKMNKKAFNN